MKTEAHFRELASWWYPLFATQPLKVKAPKSGDFFLRDKRKATDPDDQ